MNYSSSCPSSEDAPRDSSTSSSGSLWPGLRRPARSVAKVTLIVVGLATTLATSASQPFEVSAAETLELEANDSRVVDVVFNAETAEHLHRYPDNSYLQIRFDTESPLEIVSSDAIEPSSEHLFRPPVQICAEEGPCVLSFTVVGGETPAEVSIEAAALTYPASGLFAENRSFPAEAAVSVDFER